MFKRLVVVVSSLAIAQGAGYTVHAQSTNLTVPVNKTSADDGKQMYTSYCASCHGANGRGDGPVAGSLKSAPANLTLLSKANQGTYPANHVKAVIQFGSEVGAHGSKLMPVWGPILRTPDAGTSDRTTMLLRINNLTHYIETLQAK